MPFDDLRAWIGRTETRDDRVTAQPMAALAATLDRDDPAPVPGTVVPPLWHWLYFTPLDRAGALGPDGHAKRGGFLPPVPLPRRMWAGGRLRFDRPLHVGEDIQRVSRIADVTAKRGRSGELVFVTVEHEIRGPGGLALFEAHDIVYREPPAAGEPPAAPRVAPETAAFGRELVADAVLLFRYSALTFNGHRIHYDRHYATQVEGYPGLVVHGPLIATLLLDLVRREFPKAVVRRFSFQAVRPIFDGQPFAVCGRPGVPASDGAPRLALWARDAQGLLAMEAETELASAGTPAATAC